MRARIVRPPGATGGYFSESYIVERDGIIAFLKAFDYSFALQSMDAAAALQALTAAYLFEKQVLAKCSTEKLSRVVLALADGEIDVAGYEPLSRVSYLIFEKAERDIRQHKDLLPEFDTAWALRSLHNVATGMEQLHTHGIHHQDLKPSNVLVFADAGSKVGDLGRAARQGYVAPHEGSVIAGDKTYAPPELLYEAGLSDELLRRRACDMYHVGSLLMFMFAGFGTTPALADLLSPSHLWGNWSGTYSQVLPYVRDAYDRIVEYFEHQLPEWLAEREFAVMFRQLCEPDPTLRGDPKGRTGTANQYALRRYVSKLDLLAREAEMRLRRSWDK